MPSSVDTIVADGELLAKLSTLYSLARAKKSRFYESWRRNYLLLNGRMWSEYRVNTWQASPIDSEIYPITSSLIGWMTDQDLSVTLSAVTPPSSPTYDYQSQLADQLQQLLQSLWYADHWDAQVTLTIWDAAQNGTGILKSVWDQSLNEGLGNASLRRIDPWSFYPDPTASDMSDGDFYIEVRLMSFDDLKRRFPDAYDTIIANEADFTNSSAGLAPSRPDLFGGGSTGEVKVNLGSLPSTGSAFGLPLASSSGSYGLPGQSRNRVLQTPGIDVYEYWLKDTRTIHHTPTNEEAEGPEHVSIEAWRVILVASNVILLDEWAEDLYGMNSCPYSRYCFEDIGEFWGIPLISHLAPPQIAINRILAAIQQNAELIGNPVLLEWANSGSVRTPFVNKPGARVSLDATPNAGQNKPEWLIPPNLPSFIENLLKFWIDRMENISGLSSTTKGQNAPPRTPSGSVTSTQEAGFVRVRSYLRNLERAISQGMEIIAQLIIENYTVPRVVAITGEDSTSTAYALAARHFHTPTVPESDEESGDMSLASAPLKYSILIDAGASNPTSRVARISEADTLFAMGAIDQKAVLDAHNYPNRQSIVSRMQSATAGQPAPTAKSRVKGGRTT